MASMVRMWQRCADGEAVKIGRRERLQASADIEALSCSLSLSVRIVAGRDDFVERGSVSRSTLRATDALDLSKRWAAGKAPAGHRPALLWLRLRRAVLYRRVALCQSLGNAHAQDRSHALPTASRRYSRLKICTASG